MKTYLRQNIKYNGYKLAIDTIDDNSFSIKIWKRMKDFDLGDLAYNELPDFSKTYTKNEFLKDHFSKLPINEDHAFILVGTPLIDNNYETRAITIDIFKHTYASKSSVSYLRKINKLKPLMYIAIPFATSKISDWIIISEAEKFIVNNIEVTETYDFNPDSRLIDFFPSISLNKIDNQITAQLNVEKAGVEIYFETTSGSLSSYRAITNDQGVATTQTINATEGKVKAGFKYFSGKAEILI